jgi:tetratricopeptide (TPR) repeat protein
MDENALLERLDRLEQSIKSLQTGGPVSKPAEPRATKFQRLCKFLLANWVLLSFVFALATAVYVKFAFGVDYLRDYRSIKLKHDLGDFHTRMGDILMGRGEWAAAEDAYRNAQQIDPENLAAARGIVKAQVLKPPAGEKYYVPEVVDAKLRYLLSLYPEDAQLSFLKGVRLQEQGDEDDAMETYKKAIAKNKNSPGSRVNLGFIYAGEKHFNMDEAIKNLEESLELDSDYPLTHQNLGFLYLLSLNFAKAVEHEKRAFDISAKWSNAYNLGEAYRYSGDFGDAIRWHKFVLERLSAANSEDDPFVRQSATQINYMPVNRQDRETIKTTVTVYGLEDKKIFTHYALSFDYALADDFDNANKELREALRMNKNYGFSRYYESTIDSIENLCNPSGQAKKWFESHRGRLFGSF